MKKLFTDFIQKFSADEKSFEKKVLLKSLTSIKKVEKTYFHVCVYAIRKAESEIKKNPFCTNSGRKKLIIQNYYVILFHDRRMRTKILLSKSGIFLNESQSHMANKR